eukprot:GHVP01063410.1.p1 GENE.GHVP01063410.1~~GHVP01063410.1.p1  ORF type:complete len:107 (-),score=6.50 GHVP01063410.1:82-402(-)
MTFIALLFMTRCLSNFYLIVSASDVSANSQTKNPETSKNRRSVSEPPLMNQYWNNLILNKFGYRHFLLLEDLVYGYHGPSIIDLKIGDKKYNQYGTSNLYDGHYIL